MTTLFGNPLPTTTREVVTRRREHLTFRGNVKSGRHGWLRLTPAYSLHVVNEILESAPRSALVLDPFSGTGTTALVGNLLGFRVHAVEINPFLVWLGNLKLREYPGDTPRILKDAASDIVAQLRRRARLTRAWVPDLHQIEKWWDKPVLDALSQLFASVSRYATENKKSPAGDLLKVAFCKAMIKSSHASFGHQSMSFVKQTSAPNSRLFGPVNSAAVVFKMFTDAMEEVAASLDGDQPLVDGVVYEGDARCLESVLPVEKYTTVVTSPPYPNRMSYIRELRPYMYWLGFLTNGRAAGELDWQAIGGTWGCATSNLATWGPGDDGNIPYPRFDRIVRAISEDHPLLGRYVHKYFIDIRQHLQSLRGVVKAGGRCYYIVGNSKFYGTLLPVEKIYAALFKDVGFWNCSITTLRKRNSKKELFEYVVRAETPCASTAGISLAGSRGDQPLRSKRNGCEREEEARR